MSILKKFNKAIADCDVNLANEIIHDDFKFLLHSSGKTLGKKDEYIKKLKEFFNNIKGTDGLVSMKQIQTGPNTMCIIGEWKDEQSIAKAREKMIAGLDSVRSLLEEISPELGVTDPVSGPVIMENK